MQAGAAAAVYVIALSAGLAPRRVRAAGRPEFDGRTLDEVVKALGGSGASESADVHFKAPDIAENGAVVPVEIESLVPGTRSIAIVVEKNPHVLSASFAIPEGTDAFIATRVKVAETCNVYALVKTDTAFFYAQKLVKVTLGGCGG
jgi:sulfur-oxidizing protein SoxY